MILRYSGVAVLVILCAFGACTEPVRDAKREEPLAVVRKLLEHHGLLGKKPEDRTLRQRETPVSRSLIEPLFADLGNDDAFLEEVYIGFVVGALTRNQDNLAVEVKGNRARILAGSAAVVLVQNEGRFRIVLAESVPEEVKIRAKREKERLERTSRQQASD